VTRFRDRRIGNHGHSFGTATIYAARSEFWTCNQGDYKIELGAKSYPKETRAYRKRAEKRGEKVRLRDEALKDEAVVLFGPDVNAEKAIKLLRKLANHIAGRGLFTGKNNLGQKTFERKVLQI
jgi:hypothetical protein